MVGSYFFYQIQATNLPVRYGASNVPYGIASYADGSLADTPTTAGTYDVLITATNAAGTGSAVLHIVISPREGPLFFKNEIYVGNGAYYLATPANQVFSVYSYLSDPRYIYHFAMGYEYVIDANDSAGGIYLYDFASSTFFYTSWAYAFPYLYDFSLNATLYYYPLSFRAGSYTTKPRYFYNFATGQIITK